MTWGRRNDVLVGFALLMSALTLVGQLIRIRALEGRAAALEARVATLEHCE